MSSCKTPDKPQNQWYVNKMKEIKALNNLVGKFQKQQQSDEMSEMTESKASINLQSIAYCSNEGLQ